MKCVGLWDSMTNLCSNLVRGFCQCSYSFSCAWMGFPEFILIPLVNRNMKQYVAGKLWVSQSINANFPGAHLPENKPQSITVETCLAARFRLLSPAVSWAAGSLAADMID